MERKLLLAWAAGIIDGEGCIHIKYSPASQHPGCKSPRHTLTLKVTMGCVKTIERIFDVFEVGCVTEHQPRTERTNASYSWVTQSKKAAAIIRECRPYFVTKAKEADIALAFDALPRYPGGSHLIPVSLHKKRHALYQQLRDAKPRARFQSHRWDN